MATAASIKDQCMVAIDKFASQMEAKKALSPSHYFIILDHLERMKESTESSSCNQHIKKIIKHVLVPMNMIYLRKLNMENVEPELSCAKDVLALFTGHDASAIKSIISKDGVIEAVWPISAELSTLNDLDANMERFQTGFLGGQSHEQLFNQIVDSLHVIFSQNIPENHPIKVVLAAISSNILKSDEDFRKIVDFCKPQKCSHREMNFYVSLAKVLDKANFLCQFSSSTSCPTSRCCVASSTSSSASSTSTSVSSCAGSTSTSQ